MRELIKVFKALSDETRLRMMGLLTNGELCVCEIMQALEISQSRASRNLGILKEAGLLVDRREGQWIYYSIDKGRVRDYSKLFELLESSLARDETVKRDKENLKRAVPMGGKRPEQC